MQLPASIQELIGRKVARVFNSSPERDEIVFDSWPSRENRQSRYAYQLNGTVDRYQNLSFLLGYTVLGIEVLDPERGMERLAIFTDGPDDDRSHVCIIHFTPFPEEEEVELVDNPIGRAPPYKHSSTTQEYIVQEDDVDYLRRPDGSYPPIPDPTPQGAWVPIEDFLNVTFYQGSAVTANPPTFLNSVVTGIGVENDGRAEGGWQILIDDAGLITSPVYIRVSILNWDMTTDGTFGPLPASITFEGHTEDTQYLEIPNETPFVPEVGTASFAPTSMVNFVQPSLFPNITGIFYLASTSTYGEGHAPNVENYEVLLEVYVVDGELGVPP